MEERWMLSKFFRDEFDNRVPVAISYGKAWFCPQYPATDNDFALVRILCSPQQQEAAKNDPRIKMCPRVGDPRPVPNEVADAHGSMGARNGMSMAEVLATLGDVEPNFGLALSRAHGH